MRLEGQIWKIFKYDTVNRIYKEKNDRFGYIFKN